jgi:hypothetical protein
LKDNESDSKKEQESEEEDLYTPVLRRLIWERSQPERYTPYDLCLNFVLFITNDDPRTVREEVDSEDRKL